MALIQLQLEHVPGVSRVRAPWYYLHTGTKNYFKVMNTFKSIPSKLCVYPQGSEVSNGNINISFSSKFSSSSRSKISSFSSSSRLRMRKFLVSNFVPNSYQVGITLTLPWKWDNLYLDDFKLVVHRFRVSWLRKFPNSGAVYRVELQQRGAPHLHIIAWHDHLDLFDDYFEMWLSAIQSMRGGSLCHFMLRGVKVDENLNTQAVFRYLSDHSSKCKVCQLGYKGKQWGVWGQSNFRRYIPFSFDLDDRQLVLLNRYLSKINRFRIRCDCVFGSKLSRKTRRRKINFISSKTISKIFNLPFDFDTLF